MKKLILPFIIVISVVLCNCEHENNNKHKTLHYLNTVYGGCNNSDHLKSAFTEVDNDTVIFNIENDTLSLYVGVNYICCAYFEGKSEFVGDSLFVTVADTCSSDDMCYCHCMCYYTFDFLYNDIDAGEIPCKVRLWDAMAEKYIILFKGTLIMVK
jgi:hypothetical protein